MNNTNQSSEGKTKNITFGFVCGWLLGILFLLAGVALIGKSAVTGITFIIAALIALPPFNSFVKNKFNIVLSRTLKIVAVLILVIIGFTQVPTSSTQNTGDNVASEAKAETPKQEVVVPVKVTAVELIDAYKANQVAAEEKYKGKLLEITGTVNSIGKDILDAPYVTLMGDQYGITNVQCYFDRSDASSLSSLTKNQKVTLTGKASSYIMNVMVKDCKVK